MRRSTLRLYRRETCSIDNWKMEKIVHCQFSIIHWIGLRSVSLDLLVLLGQAKRTYTAVWANQKNKYNIKIKIKHLYPYETIEELYVKRIYP